MRQWNYFSLRYRRKFWILRSLDGDREDVDRLTRHPPSPSTFGTLVYVTTTKMNDAIQIRKPWAFNVKNGPSWRRWLKWSADK